jgi:hypothetical protein
MGFNSVVFILNDTVHRAKENPKAWWDQAWDALCRIPGYARTREESERRSDMGEFMGQHKALWNMHADNYGLIAVGGNYATVLLAQYGMRGQRHDTKEGQVILLKALAEKLGYRVVRKTKRKAEPVTIEDDA